MTTDFLRHYRNDKPETVTAALNGWFEPTREFEPAPPMPEGVREMLRKISEKNAR